MNATLRRFGHVACYEIRARCTDLKQRLRGDVTPMDAISAFFDRALREIERLERDCAKLPPVREKFRAQLRAALETDSQRESKTPPTPDAGTTPGLRLVWSSSKRERVPK